MCLLVILIVYIIIMITQDANFSFPLTLHLQNKRDSIQANVLVTTDTKQEASATVTDGGGVTPEALPASVFGPVRKFRPVVCKSVEKETSLHSSLMEAIQSGRGRDGLKVRLCTGWID